MTKQSSKQMILTAAYESRVRDYFTLLKPRVMSLVVFTAFTGLMLAPGKIHPLLAFVAIFSIALASGASGAINMWYEDKIDGIMSRTKNRPIPSKKIINNNALVFGMTLAIISVVLMGLIINLKSAIMLVFTIFFYVVIYTIWLKPRTSQNIVIGGAAGAFPPIIGWMSVTNSISFEPIILFLIIFMWTPPHFWALALVKSDDYKNAAIPMLPLTKGDKNTKIQIFIYSIILVITSLLPFFTKMSGIIYFTAAVILGIMFLLGSYKLIEDKENKSSMKFFSFTVFYLFAIFAFLIFDHFKV